MRAGRLADVDRAFRATSSPEHEARQRMGGLRERVDERLSLITASAESQPARLHESIRYSLLAPGKRVRAVLSLVSTLHFGGEEARGMTAACALEMVHAASLILDDLPAMDDATLRRGRPANHRVYGEATAILAAIALLNQAFGVIAADDLQPMDCRLRVVACLTEAIGPDGLVAGQEMDLRAAADQATRQSIETMHKCKTGALFAASAEVGALSAGVRDGRLARVREFGQRLGLAFQTFDDLLDACGDVTSIGKDVQQDGDKPTLVAALGIAKAEREALRQVDQAVAVLPPSAAGPCLLGACARAVAGSLQDRLAATVRSSVSDA